MSTYNAPRPDPYAMAAQVGPRQFTIKRTTFAQHYTVETPAGQCLYYVDMSLFRQGRPDLAIHDGPDTTAPVVAACQMQHLSGDCRISLGNTANGCSGVQYEDLTKESFNASEYHWSMNVGTPTGEFSRRQFAWKRTRHVAADGAKISSLSMRNFKLLEIGNASNGAGQAKGGQLLAVFTNERSFHNCGTLQINVNHGKNFDLMVLITVISLYEKAKRRGRRASAAAAAS